MGGEEGSSVCGKCKEEITGQAMKAKDTLYHAEGCFVCLTCSTDLRNVAVYCKDGQLYCEKDYKTNFVPKCAKCMEYILEVSGLIINYSYSVSSLSIYRLSTDV